MKHKNNYRYLLMGLMMAVVSSAVMLSCKDDDPSLSELRDDKLAYLADSLRVSDSLRRLNQAGVVNYAITVVSGSTSSLYKSSSSRTEGTTSVIDAALVTISQFGKVVTDTTDATGMVVLNGFFRGAVNVTVRKEGHTTASFVIAVKNQDNTGNSTINYVGNIIPIFETTGANTATISGVAKIQSNLTNTTLENVPDGTTLIASIDAKNTNFKAKFLQPVDYVDNTGDNTEILVGRILDGAYSTGVIGATATDGTYSITVPSAIDGLPLLLEYSDIALSRTRFDETDNVNSSNRSMTERVIYKRGTNATAIPAAGGVQVAFDAGTGATATAEISSPGTVESINVTEGGTNWSGTPTVILTSATGTGATATATVTAGVLTGITVTAKGSGYATPPTVVIRAGSGATAAANDLNADGTVTGVIITNSGSLYTIAPTVTFSGGGAPTTPATGQANLTNGRVTSIQITNAGVGYTSAPNVVLTGGTTTGTTATVNNTARFSGMSVGAVALSTPGTNYSFAPAVVFDAPTTAGGQRATGTASIDAVSGQVTGITVTFAGTGYVTPPNINLYTNQGGTPAAQAFLTGSGVTSINVASQGANYSTAPAVTITGGGGSGATATAVVNNGHVVAINMVAQGNGYTSVPTVTLNSGSGAVGVVTVGANGAITGVRITTNGSGYTGTPLVTFSTGGGGRGDGAVGVATVSGGQVTGVTLSAGGAGYLSGNTPSGAGVNFASTLNTTVEVKTGVKYVNDVYYGTGVVQPL